MKASKAGFCILGHYRDRIDDRTGGDRFAEFRPAVAFATQTTTPLRRLYICHRRNDASLFESVRADIESIHSTESAEVDIDIRSVLVDFQNPWDFSDCFSKLGDALRGIQATGDRDILVCLNSGTHTMQFALYLLVEKAVITDLHLVQLRPGSSRLGARERNTKRAEVIPIDWEWTKAGSVIAEFERERDESRIALEPLQSRNEKTKALVLDAVSIGAFTSEPLMLYGETGTGKTILARKIHQEWVKRQPPSTLERPLREMNCAHFSGDVAYGWLFGYKKGSFTGAAQDTPGLLKSADGGTLFLDEVSELDERAQAMLLKALEEGVFYPLGETDDPTSSAFRLICATNLSSSSDSEVKVRIRLDLLARIGQWSFTLPSLRERREDIEGLIVYELNRWNSESIAAEARSAVRFQEEARIEYSAYASSDQAHWPGNFRDLISSVRRMATRASLRSNGGPGVVDGIVVEGEIAHLRRSQAQIGKQTGGEDILDAIRHYRDAYEPQLSIRDAAEKICLDNALLLTGSKADAARLVIERPGTTLSNPSARFSQRYSALET
jgi:transcriptional regulatory protein RtcR